MTIKNSTITARQAAEQFAREAFGEHRVVESISRQDENGSATFRLVNGVKTYVVRCLPDFTGWEISPA